MASQKIPDISPRVRWLRALLGAEKGLKRSLSREKLAGLIGVSHSAIKGWEDETWDEIKSEHLIALAVHCPEEKTKWAFLEAAGITKELTGVSRILRDTIFQRAKELLELDLNASKELKRQRRRGGR